MKTMIISLACFCLSLTATGQWTTALDTNTLISSSETSDIQSVGTSDGKTYVAFWEPVASPTNFELRLQLLDENGNQLFGPNGMLVNNVVPMSTFTTTWSIAVDASDNVYLAFNGTGAGNPVYVHKISTSGAQLWGGAGGINLGSGFDPKIWPLSNGEAVAAWLPADKGVFQRLSATGSLLFPSPVTIQPTISSHRTSAGELAELSDGDVVILFHDRAGFSPSSLLYAQRYEAATGAAVWASAVNLATSSTVFNRRYDVVQSGDTAYIGYSAAVGLVFYSYLQRINPDGSLPWGINGEDFSTSSTLYERDTRIAHEAGSDFIWAVCEYTNSAQSEIGEYVQKFNRSTGARLLGASAKQLFAVSPAQISHRGPLQLVESLPVFILSLGQTDGISPNDLVATSLDANGDFAWTDTLRDVAIHSSSKGRIGLTQPAGGQLVCTWAADRSYIGESRAFAQNIEVGACSTDQPPVNLAHLDNTPPGKVTLSWDPIPQSVACQVNGMRISPPGLSGQLNIFGPEPSSTIIPYTATGAGTVWAWGVRCACDIAPVDATVFSSLDTFSTPLLREQAGQNPATVQPNPATDLVHITASASITSLGLWDLSGRMLIEIQGQGGSSIDLDLSHMEPGTYVVRIETPLGKEESKLILR